MHALSYLLLFMVFRVENNLNNASITKIISLAIANNCQLYMFTIKKQIRHIRE